MRKTIAFLVASAVIVGTAYYYWVLPLAFIALIGWSMFGINNKPKKKDTPIIPIEDYLD